MLETIQSSVLAVCMLSIAVSLCLLICPDNALQKQVRFLISLLFVISLILPFKNLTFPDSLEALQIEQSDRSALQAAEFSVRNALVSILNQNGISCSEPEITLHIDENHCISISEVRLTCDNYQDAVRLLNQMLGEEVSIHVSQTLE